MIIVPKLSDGGTERVASNLSINLNSKYHQFIALYYNDKLDFPHKGEIINLGIKSKNNPVSKLICFLKRYYKIRNLKRKLNIDYSISFGENPNLINILTRYKDKIITTIHFCKTYEKKHIYNLLYDKLITLFYNKADCNITVSKMARYDLISNYKLKSEKVKCIYNFLNIDKIFELSKESIEKEYSHLFTGRTIINVGRLNYQKGHWHLIKALKVLTLKIPDIKLVIIGDGELKQRILELVKNLNLENNVFLLGFRPNPFKYIAKSDCFVLSSLYEGFPNVLVEALACSSCIVSSDCKSGPRELLAPNTDITNESQDVEITEYGILTPQLDRKEDWNPDNLSNEEKVLAEGMYRILSDIQLMNKYKDKAILRANDFSSEKIIKEYEDLLK